MVLSAFPTITHDEEYTPDNVEDVVLRQRQIMNKYGGDQIDQGSLLSAIKTGVRPQFYS